MTNKKQIQTKKISFILALSVIIYAAIDTYLFSLNLFFIRHGLQVFGIVSR